LQSRTYQLSSAANASNKLDRNNYSHAYIRPMMAEVVLDVLNSALDVTENFGQDAPAGARAIEVGSSRVQNGNLAYAFRIFGRPPRSSACDCQRALDPALPQTLYRMTDAQLLTKLNKGRLQQLFAGQKTDDEILDELFLATLTRFPTTAEKKLFAEYQKKKGQALASAEPTPEKKKPSELTPMRGKKGESARPPMKDAGKATNVGRGDAGQTVRASATNRQMVFLDTLWALINTREFILNH